MYPLTDADLHVIIFDHHCLCHPCILEAHCVEHPLLGMLRLGEPIPELWSISLLPTFAKMG